MPWAATTRGGCGGRPRAPCTVPSTVIPGRRPGGRALRWHPLWWPARLLERPLIRGGEELVPRGDDRGGDWAGWLAVFARPVVGRVRRHGVEAAVGQAAGRLAWGRRPPALGRLPPAEGGRHDACGASHARLAEPGSRGRMSRTGAGLDRVGADHGLERVMGARRSLQPEARRQAAREEGSTARELGSTSTRVPSSLGYVQPKHDAG